MHNKKHFLRFSLIRFQRKQFFQFNFLTKTKIFGNKETSLILHPELAVKESEIIGMNKDFFNKNFNQESLDENKKDKIILDENLDFIKLDANGIFKHIKIYLP